MSETTTLSEAAGIYERQLRSFCINGRVTTKEAQSWLRQCAMRTHTVRREAAGHGLTTEEVEAIARQVFAEIGLIECQEGSVKFLRMPLAQSA